MTQSLPEVSLQQLTPREKECLRLAAQHLSSKEIARKLAVSPHTVNGHIDEARRKMGVATRRDAARILLEAEERSAPMSQAADAGALPIPPKESGGEVHTVAAPPDGSFDQLMIRDGDNDRSRHAARPGATSVSPSVSGWVSRAMQGDLAPGERIGAVMIIAGLTAAVLVLLVVGAREFTDALSTLSKDG